ncbi:TetR/AcrR family transcriptional regulator [Leptospira ognonensis]|uniref:TetR/AcrR family transcriptional regulator n=1 Tax=Leptospira ognonensis TaxID=2484945 RepID=A0A4R9K7G4_9LEPT|nr:TetR/AcrR family transcriptional regulator [Leptospira ognonensis]
MVNQKRAVLVKDKLTKRTNIIQAAANLLSRKDLADLSMDAVAKKARVAKGTLYLYFPTKEDLALSVHIFDYQLWFKDLSEYLDLDLKDTFDFQEWFVQSIVKHPRFIKLLPIVPTILEKNASYETIKEYKYELLNQLGLILSRLTTRLGFKKEEDTFMFMMQCHAIAIGAWSHGFPSATVKQVLNEADLKVFLIDYVSFVKSSIDILQKGYREKL